MALKTWDGTKWVDTATAHQHDTYLQLIGGSMTGDIVLVGDPTLPLHPVTKQYADTIHGKQHVIDTVAPPTPNVGDVWVNPDFQPEGLYLPLDGSLPMTGQLSAFAGTALLPGYTFDGDPNTGMYRAAENHIGWGVGGVVRLSLRNDFAFFGAGTEGYSLINTGDTEPDAAKPAYTFGNDTDSGFYRIQSNIVAMAAGGVGVVYWDVNGTHFIAMNSTGSAANVYSNPSQSGRAYRSTSTRAIKKYISTLKLADAQRIIRELDPVKFKSKLEDDPDTWYNGFVYEDAAAVDEAIDSDGDENYDIRAIVANLVRVVQELV